MTGATQKGYKYEKSNILLFEYCGILNSIFGHLEIDHYQVGYGYQYWSELYNVNVFSDTSLGVWVQIHSWNHEFGACN